MHAIGRREVARLRAEMEAQMKAACFNGRFVAFVAFLNTDPRFFHTSAEAMPAAHRDIAKRVDPELPQLFAELPRAAYGVRVIPAHMGAGKSDDHSSPPGDRNRPGCFNANVLAIETRPVWGMETLFVHAAAPGHHLPTARALELTGLPVFRRNAGYPACGEGWAL